MVTKQQLQNANEALRAEVLQLRADLNNAQKRIKVLESVETLPDLPEDSHIPYACRNFELRDIREAAAEKALERLVQWAGRNHGHGREDEQEKQATGIGILLAHIFHYYGTPLLLVAAAGLEDANWHTEATILYQMYDRLIAAESSLAGNNPGYSDIFNPDPSQKKIEVARRMMQDQIDNDPDWDTTRRTLGLDED